MAMAAVAMVDQHLESRVARLEADVGHIRADIAEIKRDIRELRQGAVGLDGKIAQLERRLIGGLASNRIWMLLQSAVLLGVMARGFKWL